MRSHPLTRLGAASALLATLLLAVSGWSPPATAKPKPKIIVVHPKTTKATRAPKSGAYTLAVSGDYSDVDGSKRVSSGTIATFDLTNPIEVPLSSFKNMDGTTSFLGQGQGLLTKARLHTEMPNCDIGFDKVYDLDFTVIATSATAAEWQDARDRLLPPGDEDLTSIAPKDRLFFRLSGVTSALPGALQKPGTAKRVLPAIECEVPGSSVKQQVVLSGLGATAALTAATMVPLDFPLAGGSLDRQDVASTTRYRFTFTLRRN